MKLICVAALPLLILALIFSVPQFAYAQKPIEALPESQNNLEMMMKKGSVSPLDSAGVSASGLSLVDHKAVVVDFQGNVRILKPGTPQWVPVEKNMLIEEGDQIQTSEASRIDIAYDSDFLNIARIEQKTKAEFRLIEPTDLYMEDGTIFSALDGLPAGVNYQVSTPTAVAAVRGTHLATLAAGGSFTTVAVTQDLRDHISQADVTDQATGETVSILENSQVTFTEEGPKTGPVSDDIQNLADQTNAALDALERAPETAPVESDKDTESEESEDDSAVKSEDAEDEEKAAGDGGSPPDSGGADNGVTGGTEDSLLSKPSEERGEAAAARLPGAMRGEAGPVSESSLDALMDNMIPPEDFTPVDGEGNPVVSVEANSRQQGKSNEASGSSRGPGIQMTVGGSEPGEAGENGAPDVDAGALGEFFRVGMGDQFDSGMVTNPEDVAAMTQRVMENLGFDETFSRQFGEVMKKFSEISGDFNNFMAQAGDAPDGERSGEFETSSDFDSGKFEDLIENGTAERGEDGSFNLSFDLEQLGINPNDFDIDADEFARIAIDNQLFQAEVIVEIADELFSTTNQYYFQVLEALELDLTATEKAALIIATSGTELVRTYVEHDVDISRSGNEKIYNVQYYSDGTDVHARYSGIVENDLVTIVQSSTGGPYTILNIDACKPSDPEGGGAC